MKILFRLMILFVFGSVIFEHESLAQVSDRFYKIAVLGHPKLLNPFSPESNAVEIHHRLLYYPLLRSTINGQLESEVIDILKIHAIEKTFSRYSFCLKKDLKFSDGSAAQSQDLAFSIQHVAKKSPELGISNVVPLSTTCVAIFLRDGDTDFPLKFASFRTALIKASSANLPEWQGVGPFRLISRTSKKWSLVKNEGHGKGNLKQIELESVQSKELPESLLRFDDLNFLVGQARPFSYVKARQKSEIALAKAYVVVLNFKIPSLRRKIALCLDAEGLRNEINKSDLEFKLKPIDGLFVRSLPGSDLQFKNVLLSSGSDCSNTTFPNQKSALIWLVPHVAALKVFEKAATILSAELKLKVITKAVSRDEMWSFIKEKDSEYMVMLGAESPRHSISEFAELFLSSGVIHPEVPGVAEGLKKVLAFGRKDQQEPAREFHRFLIQTSHVVPLGQATVSRYYPAGTESLEWDERGNAIPRYENIVVPGF